MTPRDGPPQRAAASHDRDDTPSHGFTLVELVVAMAILMVVMGAVFTLVSPSHGTFQSQVEAADLYQRLRVGVDVLTKEIRMAGSGIDVGPMAGALHGHMAPVWPHRIGGRGGESGVFRNDTIAVLTVPPTAAHGLIRPLGGADRMARTATDVLLEPRPYCAADDPLCGFAVGMRAVIADRHGAWDLVTISGLSGDVLQFTRDGPLSTPYASGSMIAEVTAHTYYLHTDTRANTGQLRRYDGYASDLPVVDEVVGLQFEYYGDPRPPQRIPEKALSDRSGPWTTYGPPPPPLAASPSGEAPAAAYAWPEGESCLFMLVEERHVPRLPVLAGDGMVRLDGSMLSDGPWCPDATFANRFDADLLRVRRVRVVLRVQAATAALRGPAGPLFTRGGSATSPQRYLPDVEVAFDVTPRNMRP